LDVLDRDILQRAASEIRDSFAEAEAHRVDVERVDRVTFEAEGGANHSLGYESGASNDGH
jgi:hypothetical protein